VAQCCRAVQRTDLLAPAPPDVAVTTEHLLTYLNVSGKATYMPVKPITTRHRASTSVYSLTFRVRVTTHPQYGRNGTAHAAGASILSPTRGVFAGMRSVRLQHACGVRWAWRITAGLYHAFPYGCHSNATRAPIANPPNSVQLGGIPYHSPELHPGPCNSVGMRPQTYRQTHTHIHRQTHRRA